MISPVDELPMGWVFVPAVDPTAGRVHVFAARSSTSLCGAVEDQVDPSRRDTAELYDRRFAGCETCYQRLLEERDLQAATGGWSAVRCEWCDWARPLSPDELGHTDAEDFRLEIQIGCGCPCPSPVPASAEDLQRAVAVDR